MLRLERLVPSGVTGPSWIATERTPRLYWPLILVPAVAAGGLIVLYIQGSVYARVGLIWTVLALTVLVSLTIAGEVWLTSFRPRAVRAGRFGVDVVVALGWIRRFTWSEIHVTPARLPSFGVLRWGDPPSAGFYVLSPKQYALLLSSPFRALNSI